MWKKRMRLGVAVAAFVLAWVPTISARHEVDPLTNKERFALELQQCATVQAADDKPSACKLYGKIKFVDSFPDVKVQAVDSFPDIKVKIVESFPDEPGKWKIVDSFPDYKVQMVDSFPDYKIKFVESFPGCEEKC